MTTHAESANDDRASTSKANRAPSVNHSVASAAARYREFDFWVGDWDVLNAKGKRVGENKIEKSLNGYLILENWTSAGGGQGRSMNFLDRHVGMWHQIWVDDSGGVIDCVGSLKDGSMKLVGTHAYAKDGRVEQYRMSFTPNPNGDVIQHIEQSKDNGRTWYVWFHGRYVRRNEPVLFRDKNTKLNETAPRRRFDFWLGDWDAMNPAGKKSGRNRIQRFLAGCLLVEHWYGGSEGMSFNFFDPGLKKWRQQWVSDGGGLVWYEGNFWEGAMRMTGTNLKPDGTAVPARVVWTPPSATGVHHLIEHRAADRTSWSSYFDGMYRPHQ